MQEQPEQKVFFSRKLIEIEESPLLEGLDEESIAFLAQNCELISKKRGTFIIYEGDEAKGIYIVNKGIAKVVKISLEGRESILHLVYPGGLIGESPIFHESNSPINAFALTDLVARFIPKKIVLDLVQKSSHFALNMMRVLSLRERMLYHKLGATQLQSSARSRLCGWILHRMSMVDSRQITIGLSQDVLAKLLGVARETLNRELVALAKAGIIVVSAGDIEVLNIKKLKSLRDS